MSTELLPVGPLPRYLAGGPSAAVVVSRTDVLVVGAGIAGLTVALSLPSELAVEVVLKGRATSGGSQYAPGEDGSTGRAQGGIAAVLGEDDSSDLHLADTIAAGAGLCEPDAVRALVDEAPAAIGFLEANGVRLDAPGGSVDLTREGGHSRRRVAHAGGDATGRELMRGLTDAARRRGIGLEEGFLVDLLTGAGGRVCGALLWRSGGLEAVLAPAVVLATGGFGRLFAETTSPLVCTGDGVGAALRAGADVADLEFVQFHPTAIQLAHDPRPLASEALRGEGAVIRRSDGEAVMAGTEAGDLSPRDLVSRTMALAMKTLGADHLFLDATAIGENLPARFPSFFATARAAGLDPRREWVPVAPAVHYTMGGVRTDLFGRASLGGLYAVGEVAASGVHGANRLASNSLVEGVVFGRRVAAALTEELAAPSAARPGTAGPQARLVPRGWLRAAMTAEAGVLRSEIGLTELARELTRRAEPLTEVSPAGLEDANLTLLAEALVSAALRRTESRGAHHRIDVPRASPRWSCHQVLSRDASGRLSVRDLVVGARSTPAAEGRSGALG